MVMPSEYVPDDSWVDQTYELFKLWCEEHEYFVAFEFTIDMQLEPRPAMAAVIRLAQDDGIIMEAGLVKYTDPLRKHYRAKPMVEWRSLVYSGGGRNRHLP